MGSLTGSMENWLEDYPVLNTVPSAADHLKMIEHLDQIRAGPVVEPDITKLQPSDLPPCFPLTSKYVTWTRVKEWKAQHGSWKEKAGSLSALLLGWPDGRVVGAKRTMEFYQNGTATDWVMDQYFLLADMLTGLLMEDNMTLCHVYQQKRKGPLNYKEYSPPKENLWGNFVPENYGVDGLLPTQDEHYSPFFHENFTKSQNQQAANNQEAVLLPTAKRKSGVWNDFTKIYVKDPAGNLKQEYAMCNSCHILLKAPSSYGTTHLRSHTGTCGCKRTNTVATTGLVF